MRSRLGLGLLIVGAVLIGGIGVLGARYYWEGRHPVRSAEEAIMIARTTLIGDAPAEQLEVTKGQGDWIVADRSGAATAVIDARTGRVVEVTERFIARIAGTGASVLKPNA